MKGGRPAPRYTLQELQATARKFNKGERFSVRWDAPTASGRTVRTTWYGTVREPANDKGVAVVQYDEDDDGSVHDFPPAESEDIAVYGVVLLGLPASAATEATVRPPVYYCDDGLSPVDPKATDSSEGRGYVVVNKVLFEAPSVDQRYNVANNWLGGEGDTLPEYNIIDAENRMALMHDGTAKFYYERPYSVVTRSYVAAQIMGSANKMSIEQRIAAYGPLQVVRPGGETVEVTPENAAEILKLGDKGGTKGKAKGRKK